MDVKQSKRIQTSILNASEKKVLVWLAERQPRWVTSDMLTLVGMLGSVIIATGYILSNININFLWLASFGFVVNWYGDFLDGTLARVRNQQRPIYGFYVDHTVDAINELLMFVGAGLSPLMDVKLAVVILVIYLMLTLNVSVNAHLKNEFKLTYAKLGPTEFRIVVILVNTLLVCFRPLTEIANSYTIFDHEVTLHVMDYVGAVILAFLIFVYLVTIVRDAREYAKKDPLPKP